MTTTADDTSALVDQLRKELASVKEQLGFEKRRRSSLSEELRCTKENHLAVQKQVEIEEEAITNKLMKRLQQLKTEKQSLTSEVEQEENYIVNTLQKKLEQLSAEKQKLNLEKVDLERQLEAEQEFIVNKLQKQVEQLGKEKRGLHKEKTDLQKQVTDLANQVDKLNRDKVKLENALEMEEEGIVNRLQRQLEVLTHNYRLLEAKLEARGLSSGEVSLSDSETEQCKLVYSRQPVKPDLRSLSMGHAARSTSSATSPEALRAAVAHIRKTDSVPARPPPILASPAHSAPLP